jgi:MFS family permease
MAGEDKVGAPPGGGIDLRLHAALLVHSMGIQAVVALLKVTTSYRALEIGLPVVWLGLISATFALLPIFIAVFVGRFIDRGNDAAAAWIGSGLVAVACSGFAMLPASPYFLLLTNAVLGIGHLFLMASHQMICFRSAGPDSRELAFGNYLVAAGLGQALGPLLVGWIGGSARIPPTHLLFLLAFAGSLGALALAFVLRPAPGRGQQTGMAAPVPVAELLRTPGLLTLLAASIITITAQDLLVIYLPLLGTERAIDVSNIGLLLTSRSIASVIARLGYAPMIRAVGRVPLTVSSMSLGAATFLALAIPLPLWAMYLVIVVMGLALGIASTLSITSVVDVAPPQARGTVMSMRISGNRIGQVLLPFLAGLIAAATGAAGVLALIGASLAASGGAVYLIRKKE